MDKTVYVNQKNDYFFVYMGRKPNGYLELLGLSPDESNVNVKKAGKAYRQGVIKNCKKEMKSLDDSLKNKKITREEFDAQETALKEEKTLKLDEINKLKKDYNKFPSEMRRLKKEGLPDERIKWVDIYKTQDTVSEAALLKMVLAKLMPVSKVAESTLAEIELPGNTARQIAYKTSGMAKLGDIKHILTKMNLSIMIGVDRLFSRIKFTNLQYWQNAIELWGREYREISPGLRMEPVLRNCIPMQTEFPSLSNTFPLEIEGLQDDDAMDTAGLPDRRGDRIKDDIAALLAELLAGRRGPGEENSSGSRRKKKKMSQMEMFFNLLGGLDEPRGEAGKGLEDLF